MYNLASVQSDHKEGGVVRVRSVNGSNDLDSFDNTQQSQQTDLFAFKNGKRKSRLAMCWPLPNVLTKNSFRYQNW